MAPLASQCPGFSPHTSILVFAKWWKFSGNSGEKNHAGKRRAQELVRRTCTLHTVVGAVSSEVLTQDFSSDSLCWEEIVVLF